MARDFVHLHNHTEYSLLDGATRVGELADLVKAQGSPAVAMTDHGNLFGAVDFAETVKKTGVQPILGCEVYVAPGSRFDKKITDNSEYAYHLVLLVENDEGYRNLSRLVTAGYMEGMYYKPRVDWELLQKHSGGLTALSGCLAGEVARAISAGDRDLAKQKASMLRDIFGPAHFFMEIQANGLAEQQIVNDAKIALAKDLGVGLVATNDNHYLRKEDAFPHDCLLCIQTRRAVEETDRLKFPNDQFYVKSPDEMWDTFKHVPEALENTLRIAERCKFEFKLGEFHIPHFASKEADEEALIVEAAHKGLAERFVEFEQRGVHLNDEQKRAYRERLDYELGVIKKMGFSGYFLIVSDFIRWAKRNGIPVGPGRGSAAGSLVSYAIRITDIDPLKYGLLFERMLNPGRKSMPDIDVDLCMNRRGEVIDYVSKRYGGAEHVAQIAAFGTAKGRQIFKDVGRVFGLTFAETDRVTKLMPTPPKEFTLAEIYQSDPELKKLVSSDKRLLDVYEIAQRLEGITRNASVHAAGVVISDKPLIEYTPLWRGDHGETVTQFEMTAIEKIGLVKFDFLGLKTLTAIQIALQLIKEYEGIELDLERIPENDAKTFALLQAGQTAGVFQLESDGMRRLLKRLHPETLEEIIAVNALYRPGPMESGMLDDYVERKHGRKKIDYFFPVLEPILKETHGVIVYQEQVMEIAKVLAGYTLPEADDLRKAMGKKIAEAMQKQRQRFIAGAVANGHSEKKAADLFDLIDKFAHYGFNKSHSAAYGLIAYRTAYLKAHHPVAYMAALLQCDRDHPQKLIPLLREARQMGIQILPPDVNLSGITFTPDQGRIRFGLAAIKNVGEKPVERILEVRKKHGSFKTLTEFLRALEPGTINKKVLEGFIRSGALDTLGQNRRAMFEHCDKILEWLQRQHQEKRSGQRNLFGNLDDHGGESGDLELPKTEPWQAEALAHGERETIGVYLSAHPLDPYLDTIRRFANTTLSEEDISRFGDGATLHFGGVIAEKIEKNSPRGRFAFLQVEDKEGVTAVHVYAERYLEFRELLQEGAAVFIEGDLKIDSESTRKIFAKKIIPIADIEAKLGSGLHISLPLAQINTTSSEQLAYALRQFPGSLTVTLHVQDGKAFEVLVRLPKTMNVLPHERLRKKINDIFAGRAIVYVETGGLSTT